LPRRQNIPHFGANQCVNGTLVSARHFQMSGFLRPIGRPSSPLCLRARVPERASRSP